MRGKGGEESLKAQEETVKRGREKGEKRRAHKANLEIFQKNEEKSSFPAGGS